MVAPRRTALDYANGASIAYEYDAASRLLEIDNQTNSGYHNYDAVGNRTTVVDGGGTTTYTANALNQYTAVGETNYSYDDNGNLLQDEVQSYSYDPRAKQKSKCKKQSRETRHRVTRSVPRLA